MAWGRCKRICHAPNVYLGPEATRGLHPTVYVSPGADLPPTDGRRGIPVVHRLVRHEFLHFFQIWWMFPVIKELSTLLVGHRIRTCVRFQSAGFMLIQSDQIVMFNQVWIKIFVEGVKRLWEWRFSWSQVDFVAKSDYTVPIVYGVRIGTLLGLSPSPEKLGVKKGSRNPVLERV